ncbi:MAG: hypothetical protein IH612_16270 [Desulfofustis sp.]|nr:hypothetical protein [Desulfofustis sp.]
MFHDIFSVFSDQDVYNVSSDQRIMTTIGRHQGTKRLRLSWENVETTLNEKLPMSVSSMAIFCAKSVWPAVTRNCIAPIAHPVLFTF